MSAQFYVKRARSDVAALRQRMQAFGDAFDAKRRIDVAEIANVGGNCEVVFVPGLSETRAIETLRRDFGLDDSDVRSPTEAPLAGMLCVAEGGAFRWILVRAEDSPERQRFTIAHELGHLFVEVEPSIAGENPLPIAQHLAPDSPAEVRFFSRCAVTEPIETASPSSSRRTLSEGELNELRAHQFAAELLMPYEGVRELIVTRFGSRGIRTAGEVDQLIREVVMRYGVSIAAARRRVEKDLGIVPIAGGANTDLFGKELRRKWQQRRNRESAGRTSSPPFLRCSAGLSERRSKRGEYSA